MTATTSMQWASAVSRRAAALAALDEAAAEVTGGLRAAPDLVLVFASSHYAATYAELARAANARFPGALVVGCAAESVLGNGVEVERSESLALLAGTLPGVELLPFHLERAPRDAVEWRALIGAEPSSLGGCVLFGDPFDDVDSAVGRLDAVTPEVPKIGGLVSGVGAPGDAAMFLGGNVLRDGVLGLGLRGALSMRTLVAQGCRPIGKPMIVMRCRDQIVDELDVGKPVEVLRGLFEGLDPRDQELGRHSLYLGVEMGDRGGRYAQGDFLIREIAGMDPTSGAMALHGRIRPYQVVQFHLRDARTATEDLEARLARLPRLPGVGLDAQGAILVSCVGRGRALYGTTGHDSQRVRDALGALPLAGFFASGELGQVGGQTFLHGYTCVLGIVGPPAPSGVDLRTGASHASPRPRRASS
jgi:small ligand-binding sensory domain FIST